MKDKIGIIEVYTDGSLRREKTGVYSGYGIYFPNKELANIAGSFNLEPLTNNRAELYAIYRAIKKITKIYDFDLIVINTDSEYSMKSITEWMDKWKKNNWINSRNKPVENQDILKMIDMLIQKYPNKIKIIWVRAHNGIESNEQADRLANKGADIQKYKKMKI